MLRSKPKISVKESRSVLRCSSDTLSFCSSWLLRCCGCVREASSAMQMKEMDDEVSVGDDVEALAFHLLHQSLDPRSLSLHRQEALSLSTIAVTVAVTSAAVRQFLEPLASLLIAVA